MREIKFRAWIERKKELLYLKGFRYSGMEKIKITFADEDFDDCTYTYLRKDVVLEQFTGLQDKNGTDIYENDVVKIKNNYYKVVFEIGSFMLVRCSCEIDMYEQFEDCWNDDVYPLSQLYWSNNCEENIIYDIEVIGNIHETDKTRKEN